MVTSCNDDFNLSRLERYLAVAFEAQVEPVIVITKADLCDDSPEPYLDQANALGTSATVVAVNGMRSPSDLDARAVAAIRTDRRLRRFFRRRQIHVGEHADRRVSQTTTGIREDDSRGRHTTTSREMFPLDCGAWVIDTPGMRELKIGALDSGLRTVFDNIESLASQCHFRDCRHEAEAGCAVLAAIEAGTLDPRRLASYRKLQREAALRRDVIASAAHAIVTSAA